MQMTHPVQGVQPGAVSADILQQSQWPLRYADGWYMLSLFRLHWLTLVRMSIQSRASTQLLAWM